MEIFSRLVILLTVIIELPETTFAREDPMVKIVQGWVSGKIVRTSNRKNINAFRGIPYAEAPVGNLRFSSPVAKKPWSGIINRAYEETQCLQLSDDNVIGVEDCLVLNVYTRKINRAGKLKDNLYPVMFYIHGGGFTGGTGNYDNYGPGYLLDREIVLVTINYRLDILGFLSTGDEEIPGNFGLKDQLLALKWLQDNIVFFGGDPRNVTIFGESAGGASVHILALSPLSEGLFQRYIIQSGCALGPWAFRNIDKYASHAFRTAELLNCSSDSSSDVLDCLRKTDATTLLTAGSMAFDSLRTFALSTWGPTVEPEIPGAVITQYPWEIISNGGMRDLPLITGQVRNEGLFVTTALYANDSIYEYVRMNIEQLVGLVISEFTNISNPVPLTQQIMDFYFGENITNDKTTFIGQLTDLLSDSFFFYPEIKMLNTQIKFAKSPIYFYLMGYRGSHSGTEAVVGNNDLLGVPHADDLIYLFSLDPKTTFNVSSVEYSDSDIRMKDTMVDLWTSFAINSFPTTKYMETPDMWEVYKDSNSYLLIGNYTDPSLFLLRDFYAERMEFWSGISEGL